MGSSGFSQGAGHASKSQIARDRCSFSRSWVDVVNVEDRFLGGLRQSAVLAAIVSPFAHEAVQGDGHTFAHDARRFFASRARSRIRDRRSTNSVRALASRLSFVDSLPVRSCLSSNSCKRACKGGANRNFRQSAGSWSSTTTVCGMVAPSNPASPGTFSNVSLPGWGAHFQAPPKHDGVTEATACEAPAGQLILNGRDNAVLGK
jgi:hypothetical protein